MNNELKQRSHYVFENPFARMGLLAFSALFILSVNDTLNAMLYGDKYPLLQSDFGHHFIAKVINILAYASVVELVVSLVQKRDLKEILPLMIMPFFPIIWSLVPF